jgi:molybdopterin-guanine dinucleotide biosynthesis protein B
MKIIHVAGLSGAGKTHFISRLVPLLSKRGPVAVVKHLGHHQWDLPEGKDTTIFFESGAVSVGIDSHKSVLVTEEHDLDSVLGMLDRVGIAFTIIEGFKQKPYPKITIGALPRPENVLFEDPPVEVVLENLDLFPEFPAAPSRMPGDAREQGNAPFTLRLEIPSGSSEWESREILQPVIQRVERHYPGLRGNLARSAPGGEKISLQISAPDRRAAYAGMSEVLKEMEELIPHSPIPGLQED